MGDKVKPGLSKLRSFVALTYVNATKLLTLDSPGLTLSPIVCSLIIGRCFKVYPTVSYL